MSDGKPTVGLVVPVDGPSDPLAIAKLRVATNALREMAAIGTDDDKRFAWEAFSAGVEMDTRDTPSEAFEVWWSKR